MHDFQLVNSLTSLLLLRNLRCVQKPYKNSYIIEHNGEKFEEEDMSYISPLWMRKGKSHSTTRAVCQRRISRRTDSHHQTISTLLHWHTISMPHVDIDGGELVYVNCIYKTDLFICLLLLLLYYAYKHSLFFVLLCQARCPFFERHCLSLPLDIFFSSYQHWWYTPNFFLDMLV